MLLNFFPFSFELKKGAEFLVYFQLDFVVSIVNKEWWRGLIHCEMLNEFNLKQKKAMDSCRIASVCQVCCSPCRAGALWKVIPGKFLAFSFINYIVFWYKFLVILTLKLFEVRFLVLWVFLFIISLV